MPMNTNPHGCYNVGGNSRRQEREFPHDDPYQMLISCGFWAIMCQILVTAFGENSSVFLGRFDNLN